MAGGKEGRGVKIRGGGLGGSGEARPGRADRGSAGCAEREAAAWGGCEAGARWAGLGLSHRHLVLRFWNQVLTCASVILRDLASAALSAEARYFWRWNRFSSSQICTREKDVRGFLRLGGVLFWYGWPMRRVTVKGVSAAAAAETHEAP